MRSIILVVAILVGRAQPPAPAPAGGPDSLVGVWEGQWRKAQINKCSIEGGREQIIDARLIVRVGPDGRLVAGLVPSGLPLDKVILEAKVRVTGDGLRVEVPRSASCGETFKRKYTVKYDGALPALVDGRRTMHLKGIDTPCIMMGCRFGDVLELTWKGPEQP
jgi:hypothetical protein